MNRLVFLFSVFGTEGVLISVVNAIIIFTVFRHKRLRHEKGYIVMAGLAFGDFLNGLGLATAGPHRLWLTINNRVMENVTNRECLMKPYSFLWIYGMPLASVMLTCVSVDRLLAVLFPYRYFKWGTRYAHSLVGTFFGFSFLLGTAGVVVGLLQPVIRKYPAVCFTDYALVDSTYRFIFWNTITMGGLISVILYIPVYLLYLKHQKVRVAGQEEQAVKQSMKKQRRLLVTLAISSVFTFVFFVFPSMAILAFAGSVPAQMYAVVAPLAGVLKNINPILNFFIYVKRHKDIKLGFICMLKCKEMPIEGNTAALQRSRQQAQRKKY